jgi:hypothetical protein
MTPTCGSWPSARERRVEGRSARAGPRWAALGEAEQAGQLGRAGGKEGKEERPAGLEPRGSKRERGKRKRVGEKELHSNIFKFEFKI